jgi:hypothetical protein
MILFTNRTDPMAAWQDHYMLRDIVLLVILVAQIL